MASDPPQQPRHLTLIELAFNYGLFAGVGYWVAGALGAAVGAGVITARYAYLIWVAIHEQADGASQTSLDREH